MTIDDPLQHAYIEAERDAKAARAAAFVIAELRRTGVAPAVRAVAKECGWSSAHTAHLYLQRAVELGLLSQTGGSRRRYGGPLKANRCPTCGQRLESA